MNDDDMWDEVPVPHFEDELWSTLAQVHAGQQRRNSTGPTGAQAPPQLVDLAAATATRRRGRRLVLAGVGSMAAAAALVAGIVVTGGDEGPDTEMTDPGTSAAPESPDDGQPVELTLAAKITSATEEARASSVVHVVQDATTGPDNESWGDEQSGMYRDVSLEDGEPTFDSGPAVAPGLDDVGPGRPPAGMGPTDPAWPKTLTRQVDYCFAEYEENEKPATPSGGDADRVGERLANGELVEGGHEEVDGRELLRLIEVPVSQRPPAPTDPTTTSTVPANPTTTIGPSPTTTVAPAMSAAEVDMSLVEHIIYVDPETNRPVRTVGYPGSDAEYVMTIEYLPRTPENLALISPPIPDGFTKVDRLGGDGARRDRCG